MCAGIGASFSGARCRYCLTISSTVLAMTDSIDDRRKAAYEKLREVVEELSAIAEEARGDQDVNAATAWCLVVGYEFMDIDNELGGFTMMFPKDGSQATWKTRGLLTQVLEDISSTNTAYRVVRAGDDDDE